MATVDASKIEPREIELTPEMVEAGVNALWATGAIEHPSGLDEGVVQRVFNAMISVSSFATKAKSACRESRRLGQ
jgi:hypothetical protein